MIPAFAPRPSPHGTLVLLLALLVVLAGCAETRHVMRYGVEEWRAERRPFWPTPPERPRYSFAGQLIGWENFPIVEEDRQQKGKQVLTWLVGLDPETGLGRREDESKGLQRPQTGMVDAEGRILVTDSGQNVVMVFDEAAGKLFTWEAASKREKFVSPVGIAPGPDRSVFVADSELKRVFRLNRDGEPLGEWGAGLLQRPTGLARDPERKVLYVADSQSDNIRMFSDEGTLLETIGSPGSAPGAFNGPTHVAFANQRLYVADTLNARVQVFDVRGKYLFSFGERGIRVGNMVRPKGVAVDGEGNIYVVESLHDHLLVFDKEGRFLLPIGGTGKEVGQFYLPSGVWVDKRGRVFVADMFNGRVKILQFLGGS
ncbi:MAG: 6-bladed beta-propeller [Magnetococcales bacterium]|nr:6-bladed beta-propeller [Magnetococcales bacterium]